MLPAHSDFLLSKVRFHNAHTDFNGNISLDAYLQHTNNRLPNDAEWYSCPGFAPAVTRLKCLNTASLFTRSLEIVTHLLDHQDAALRFERDVLGMLQLNSTQVSSSFHDPLVLVFYSRLQARSGVRTDPACAGDLRGLLRGYLLSQAARQPYAEL